MPNGVIQAAHYGETVKKLMAEPVIIRMAMEASNEPAEALEARDGFMLNALNEYNRRCEVHGVEQVPTHIGGPKDAILALVPGFRAAKAKLAEDGKTFEPESPEEIAALTAAHMATGGQVHV